MFILSYVKIFIYTEQKSYIVIISPFLFQIIEEVKKYYDSSAGNITTIQSYHSIVSFMCLHLTL